MVRRVAAALLAVLVHASRKPGEGDAGAKKTMRLSRTATVANLGDLEMPAADRAVRTDARASAPPAATPVDQALEIVRVHYASEMDEVRAGIERRQRALRAAINQRFLGTPQRDIQKHYDEQSRQLQREAATLESETHRKYTAALTAALARLQTEAHAQTMEQRIAVVETSQAAVPLSEDADAAALEALLWHAAALLVAPPPPDGFFGTSGLDGGDGVPWLRWAHAVAPETLLALLHDERLPWGLGAVLLRDPALAPGLRSPAFLRQLSAASGAAPGLVRDALRAGRLVLDCAGYELAAAGAVGPGAVSAPEALLLLDDAVGGLASRACPLAWVRPVWQAMLFRPQRDRPEDAPLPLPAAEDAALLGAQLGILLRRVPLALARVIADARYGLQLVVPGLVGRSAQHHALHAAAGLLPLLLLGGDPPGGTLQARMRSVDALWGREDLFVPGAAQRDVGLRDVSALVRPAWGAVPPAAGALAPDAGLAAAIRGSFVAALARGDSHVGAPMVLAAADMLLGLLREIATDVGATYNTSAPPVHVPAAAYDVVFAAAHAARAVVSGSAERLAGQSAVHLAGRSHWAHVARLLFERAWVLVGGLAGGGVHPATATPLQLWQERQRPVFDVGPSVFDRALLLAAGRADLLAGCAPRGSYDRSSAMTPSTSLAEMKASTSSGWLGVSSGSIDRLSAGGSLKAKDAGMREDTTDKRKPEPPADKQTDSWFGSVGSRYCCIPRRPSKTRVAEPQPQSPGSALGLCVLPAFGETMAVTRMRSASAESRADREVHSVLHAPSVADAERDDIESTCAARQPDTARLSSAEKRHVADVEESYAAEPAARELRTWHDATLREALAARMDRLFVLSALAAGDADALAVWRAGAARMDAHVRAGGAAARALAGPPGGTPVRSVVRLGFGAAMPGTRRDGPAGQPDAHGCPPGHTAVHVPASACASDASLALLLLLLHGVPPETTLAQLAALPAPVVSAEGHCDAAVLAEVAYALLRVPVCVFVLSPTLPLPR